MGHSKYGLASLAAPMTGGRVVRSRWQRYRSGRRTDAIAPHPELTNLAAANCALFVRDQETPVRIGLRGPNRRLSANLAGAARKANFSGLPKVTCSFWALAPAYLVRDNDRAPGPE